jgi:hypothetical protein
MNLSKMLSELRSERQHIEEAILTLQRLAAGRGKRRGRPPKWMAEAAQGSGAGTAAPKKGGFSAATREKMAVAQRKRRRAVKEEKAE